MYLQKRNKNKEISGRLQNIGKILFLFNNDNCYFFAFKHFSYYIKHNVLAKNEWKLKKFYKIS
jgi:hypothetical protein